MVSSTWPAGVRVGAELAIVLTGARSLRAAGCGVRVLGVVAGAGATGAAAAPAPYIGVPVSWTTPGSSAMPGTVTW